MLSEDKVLYLFGEDDGQYYEIGSIRLSRLHRLIANIKEEYKSRNLVSTLALDGDSIDILKESLMLFRKDIEMFEGFKDW